MKKNSGILTFFLSIFIFGFLIFKPALSQNAALIPPAVQQFFDNNGNPLTSGTVTFYLPGTSTLANTWKDSAETILNTNPIRLDAGGKAIIYGNQTYRQVVKDRNGNLIWDAVTAPGGGGSSPTLVGDGEPVGTVRQWAGLIVPNQYVFAYGQEISRLTYPELLATITQQLNTACTTGSNVFTAISDTTQINVGSAVELICVPPGTTVVSKTASSVILSNPSNVSLNATARFFPYGNGNGSTTFNVPDLRGVVVAGRTNMGGTASSNLTQTYYGSTSPAALGALGGLQSHTITISESAILTYTSTVHDPGHTHSSNASNVTAGNQAAGGNSGLMSIGATIDTNTTGITVSTLSNAGGQAMSIVQPTITLNYIIKITPDAPASSVSGVASLGGMQGVIACGQGLNCSANTISANGQIAGGVNTNIQFNNAGLFAGSLNFNFISPDTVTIGAAGTTGKLDIYGSSSGTIRQQAQAAAGSAVITWGTSTGTPAVTASSPLAIDSDTGNITCTGCLNNTPSALTKTDDTNVTLTLGGSPTTALLTPTSITVGWSGQLGLTRGGTAASLTASNGGIVYSNASTLAILSGTATANLPLLSGSSTTPAWATVGYPASLTSGGVLFASSATQISSSSLLTANQIMIGGGAGVAPSTFACATTTTVVHGGTPPTCSQIVTGDITTNTITNSNLSQVGAATIKMNPTSGTANVADITIQELTNLASPSATLDFIPIYDHVSGTIKNVTPGAIAGSAVAGVASVNTLVGSLTLAANSGLNIVSSGTTITITPDVATAANFEAGTANKLLDAAVVFTDETTTTYGTTTEFDFNTFINTKVTLTGNITTMNCSNMKAGQAGTISYIQDGTGGRTAAFNTGTCSTTLKFANATFPTLTTSASAIDILSYSCRTSSYCVAGLTKGYNP